MSTGTSPKEEMNFIEMMKAEIEMPRSALDSVIDWIKRNLEPDQVFNISDLEKWAEDNNYVKE